MGVIHAIKTVREETGRDLAWSRNLVLAVREALALGEGDEMAAEKTLRDEFAMAAMAAMRPDLRELQTDHRIKMAEWAYGLADAMLSVRKLGTEELDGAK